MKIAIVTDAWHPQINGVVTTLTHTVNHLRQRGHEVLVLTPEDFYGFPLPGYKEIKFALPWGLSGHLDRFSPDYLHIATEGPVGLAGRRWAMRRGKAFTTSYHTRFPEYLNARIKLPVAWGYRYLRWFHDAASNVMVNTPSMFFELQKKGFRNMVHWGRGVNTDVFTPDGKALDDLRIETDLDHAPRPWWINVGRVSVEKNLEAFYQLDLPGTKIQVGGGPAEAELKQKYPDVHFVGPKSGETLAAYYRTADVFVFPSRTDTYGIVMLEANASGLPVAAYPVPGPADIIENGTNGIVNQNLQKAAEEAIHVSRGKCRAFALGKSWEAATDEFERHLVRV